MTVQSVKIDASAEAEQLRLWNLYTAALNEFQLRLPIIDVGLAHKMAVAYREWHVAYVGKEPW